MIIITLHIRLILVNEIAVSDTYTKKVLSIKQSSAEPGQSSSGDASEDEYEGELKAERRDSGLRHTIICGPYRLSSQSSVIMVTGFQL